MSTLAAQLAREARGLKILVIDIETAPHLGYHWGLFKQNIGISQIVQPGRVLGFAHKWVGQRRVGWVDESGSHEDMVREAHKLLTEADVVVHYNGTTFDLPHLNREFLLAGLTPPRPYKQIDLLRVAKKQFNFASNKLDFVSQQLGLGHKADTGGFELWIGCMSGDAKAWAKMGRYARQDVALTEKLFHALLPWLTSVPHLAQMARVEKGCWACGSENLERDGEYTAFVTSYPLYHCRNCGAWVRLTNKLEHVTKTRRAI